MMYLDVYTDQACTNKYMSVPVIPVTYSSIQGSSHTKTIGDNTYEYYDFGQNNQLNGALIPKAAPFISYAKNRVPTATTMYMKNGLSFTVQESGSSCKCETYKVNGTSLNMTSNNSTVNSSNHPVLWAISFQTGGKTFIGFNRFYNLALSPPSSNLRLSCCFESAFWTAAQKPAYDYGVQPEPGGGQGTGDIPHTGVHDTSHTGIMPSGGRGLHWYIISKAQFNELQGYLWGEGTTIAKSLWQKFLNKTHTPVSCICGCFSLPSVFMPTGTAGTSIQLAGIQLPISAYYFSPGFSEVTYSLGYIDPPFGSWLDYYGVLVKIHVPFCGEFTTEAEKIFSKEVTIKYCVDHANGNLAAFIRADNYAIAELTGNVSYKIPVVGGEDGTLERLGAVLKIGVSAISAVSGAAEISAISASSAAADFAGAQYSTQVVNSDLSGSVSACTNGVSYIEFIYPRTAYPVGNYAATFGIPAPYYAGKLTTFTGGYGEFEPIISTFDCPSATEAEKDEIVRLLREGVIV